MRYFIALVSICLLSCCSKEEIVVHHEGTWYGHLDAHYVSKPEQHIRLDLNKGRVSISTYFHSYTSGWYDSEGTYSIGSDGIIRFDITMTPSDLFKDNPWIPIITIAHAETAYSDFSGELLKLHFTKELQGEKTSSWIWLGRKRPNL